MLGHGDLKEVCAALVVMCDDPRVTSDEMS